MRADVYRQAHDSSIQIDVEPGQLFIKVVCRDCNGSGTFHITDYDSQPCNLCKTAGYEWVTIL